MVPGAKARWSALVGLTVLLVLASPEPARADSPAPPVTLITVSATHVGDKATVELVNTTATDLTVTGGTAGRADSFVPSSPSPVPPGGRATVIVTLPADVDPKATLLLLVQPTKTYPDGWSTSVPIGAPVAAGAATDPAEPAVESWRMSSYGGWSFGAATRLGNRVPLRNTGSCASVKLPKDGVVGAAQGKGRWVSVTATCMAGADGRLYAVLSTSAMTADGLEYTGKVDLVPDDDKLGAVDLTVRHTLQPADFWLLLASGVLLAYVLRWYTGAGRKVAAQRVRIDELLNEVRGTADTDPLVQFATITRNAGLTGVPDWDLKSALEAELSLVDLRLSGLFTLAKPDAAATAEYKAAVQRVDAAEAALTAWPRLAPTLVRLAALRPNLSSLPAYERKAMEATLERDSAVALDDVATIGAAAQEALAVAAAWPHALVERVADQYTTLEKLPKGTDRFEAERVKAGEEYQAFEIRRQTAADVEAVKRAQVDFAEVDAVIVTALSLYLHPHEEAFDRTRLGGRAGGTAIVTVAVPPAPSLAPAALRSITWFLDRLVVAAVLVVALFAGAQALYIDKAMGGWWDDLATIVWGLTATTVAEPIATAIQRVGGGLLGDVVKAA